MDQVVLVDEQDNEIGTMEKLQAHLEGNLHRAVSVFIFNSNNDLLLQQRADGKYHSANLWSNTCCSHPRPGEAIHDAANRRLNEEMGLACELKKVFNFVYKADLDNNIIEHEFDHVFTGITDTVPVPEPEEVGAWKYISPDDLDMDIKINPENYTEWFKICFKDWNTVLFRK
jgi:isopentenyl-diphosphate delta-isomerase